MTPPPDDRSEDRPATGAATPPERFGDYVVERELGRGGMGIVYLARDPHLDRRVAIKVLPPEVAGDADRLTRLRREARALAALNHPNIATIYDMDEDPRHGRFLVLEWVAGQTLAERLEHGPLSAEETLAVARQVAEALVAAHARGVVHRDIKPRNVVLATAGSVKVLDFGLARRVETTWEEEPAAADRHERFTSMTDGSGAAMGTASYMSPERILGEPEDHRTDVFSFGCVLYECLTARRAFAGATRFGALAAALAARPDLDALAEAPTSVRDLIAACLRRRADERPGTMRDVLSTLTRAAETMAPGGAAHDGADGPHQLPQERTGFVGRAKELADAARLLGGTRLLTVTGIGGCGKTRLALRLAMRARAVFPGGAWFVDLASLQDADRVPLTVATTLGLREEPGKPLIETLVGRLHGAPSLIVLDNCEHVIDAVARLADALLAASAGLTLLVTSREGLGIDGERTFSLGSLSLPPGAEADPVVIEAAEAVQLFVLRARAVHAEFEMSTRTAPAVAEICRRLDGIPLAIELAAARVRLLSVQQIHARLDDRFQLLTGGSKTALPRHQTLRATLQWSEDLLSDEERRLFRVLSVFAGGWTLEAASEVAGGSGEGLDTLGLLGRLVDKSLVTAAWSPDRPTRYAMLETVRQYAQERLNELAEAEAARNRHLDCFLALAEEASPKLLGAELGAWLQRLEPEQENLLSAHAWCARAEGGGEKGLRLVAALLRYWTSRGLLELGASVAREALDRERAPTAHRASALYATGILAYAQGRYAEVAQYWEESLGISKALGDPGATARATMGLGTIAVAQGDRALARTRFAAAIATSRAGGLHQILGAALNGLAELHRSEGDLSGAVPLYEEALALFREQGSFNVAVILLNLAIVAIQQGQLDGARRRLAEVARLAEEEEARFAGWGVLELTASLASAADEPARAARVWGASEAARARLGRSLAPNDAAFVMPWIDRARAALGEPAFADAANAGRALSHEHALSEARVWLEIGEGPPG